MSHPFQPPDPASEDRAEVLFFQALKKRSEDRAGFLESECSGDGNLRAEVEAMLRDHAEADTFLSGEARAMSHLAAELLGSPLEQPGVQIGPYKLRQQIGEGGFGTVWMADQEAPMRRRVALKIIKLGMDTKDVVARFEQERQALALMDHPNIARVLDAGMTPQGRPYFVMELVRGIRITEYCSQANLPTLERLKLFMQVCHAVQHAHQKGIIHRDLKPSNILVTLHDSVPVPKVIDFGVAKATEQQRFTDQTIVTRFEQMIGTPAYMSPEQAEMSGLDIDTRSDIYSLGVLLYELLTGTTPFDARELLKAGLDEVRRVIRETDPPKPSTRVSQSLKAPAVPKPTGSAPVLNLNTSIDPDLDWIVMKALEKDRTRRYETASSFAADVQRHLNDEPVIARPPGNLYRFQKLVRRNKIAFAAAAGIAAALLTGLGFSTWQALRAKAALAELRSSAPAFAAMAQTLVVTEQFDEAIAKLDVAIKLRPDVPDYVLAKADLLEAQFRFSEAAPLYRSVMRMSPGEKRAELNAVLCEKLAAEQSAQPQLSRDSLAELFRVMTREQRPAAELMATGRLLGEQNKLLLGYWKERLRDLPIPPERPLAERFTMDDLGRLQLDLSGTDITDLSPLQGMPLDCLELAGCQNVTDLGPLRGMPLRELSVGYMLSEKGTAYNLKRKPCQVKDLSPLEGMKLEKLDISGTVVSDISALRGMPLEEVHFYLTGVSDLTPLKGMPLQGLSCDSTPVVDFSALTGMPLTVLSMDATGVRDLSFLKGMPLNALYMRDCNLARGYGVLKDLKNLVVLALPATFIKLPKEELAAIEALRDHPALQRIKTTDIANGTSERKETFWQGYDLLNLAGRDPRRVSMDEPGWNVNLETIALDDPARLKGIPIATLKLTGTGVSDLTFLKGMPLQTLYAGSNPIKDLAPLAELPLVNLFLDECPEGLDVSPLARIQTLASLVLPPGPQNVESLRDLPNLKYLSTDFEDGYRRALQTTEQYWNGVLPVTPGSLAREGKFAEAEKLLREQSALSGEDMMALGALVCAQGNEPAWQALCRELVSQTNLSNPDGMKGLAALRACLMGANCGVPAKEIESLARNLKLKWKGDTFFTMIEGLYECRNSHRERAENVLRNTRDMSSLPHARAFCDTALAISRYADGNPDYGRQTLERAREAMRGKWPQRARQGSWWDWLTVHLLLQEAEALIGKDQSGNISR